MSLVQKQDGIDSLGNAPDSKMFFVLRCQRRRRVVRYLLDGNGPTSEGELADVISAEEAGTDPEHVGAGKRKTVKVQLDQIHLPTLADAGVIDYDQRSGRVEATIVAELLRPYVCG